MKIDARWGVPAPGVPKREPVKLSGNSCRPSVRDWIVGCVDAWIDAGGIGSETELSFCVDLDVAAVRLIYHEGATSAAQHQDMDSLARAMCPGDYGRCAVEVMIERNAPWPK